MKFSRRIKFLLIKKLHDKMTRGNDARLLVDGDEGFAEMLAAIQQARHTIFFESYIYRADNIGWEFARELVLACERGINVYVHLDGLGAMSAQKDVIPFLRNHDIFVKIFHPIIAQLSVQWSAWKYFTRRNHRKILSIDNEIAFLGGLNIGDEYKSKANGGKGIHDLHLKIHGPAAQYVSQKFVSLWNKNRNKNQFLKINNEYHQKLPQIIFDKKRQAAANASVRIIANEIFFKRFVIRNAYRRLIRLAANEVCIINPYFIPDRWSIRQMYLAVKRGVSVKLILPQKNDVPLVGWAMRKLYGRLLRNGIEIYEWPGFVHAKSAVVDGTYSIVGSFNWDRLSLVKNLEIIALVYSHKLGKELKDCFYFDLQQSRSICFSEWQKRPWFYRILETLAFMLRWWL